MVSCMRLLNIILLVALCCCSSKSEKKTMATKSTLEEAVVDAAKVFESGDAEAIADLFITSEKQPRTQLLDFAKSASKSDQELKFKTVSSKVSGNMGIVLLSFNEKDSYYPYFAKWEDDQWRFFLDFLAWQYPEFTRKLNLTEGEMKDALVLQKWAVSQPYVGASGIKPHDRLAWYLPEVPENLKIELFYETPSPAMDHDYMWKIKMEDTEEFKNFAAQLTSPPTNFCGKNDLREIPVFDTHPDWWKSIKFENHKTYQYMVWVFGSNKNQKAYLFALFDEEKKYLYVQAF